MNPLGSEGPEEWLAHSECSRAACWMNKTDKSVWPGMGWTALGLESMWLIRMKSFVVDSMDAKAPKVRKKILMSEHWDKESDVEFIIYMSLTSIIRNIIKKIVKNVKCKKINK